MSERKQNQEKSYIPKIEFESFGLVVTFDHALSATPDELSSDRFKGTETGFLIHPERGLYIGLAFIPRGILKEVANGLEMYLEDQSFTDEQRALIALGVNRLNNFTNR